MNDSIKDLFYPVYQFKFGAEILLPNIANHMGSFITVDKTARRMVRVMVEFDISEGLLNSFLIKWGHFWKPP